MYKNIKPMVSSKYKADSVSVRYPAGTGGGMEEIEDAYLRLGCLRLFYASQCLESQDSVVGKCSNPC